MRDFFSETLSQTTQKNWHDWFETAFKKTPPPPYCSVDLRYSGYKLSTVDTNLFPAGFNNLHADNFLTAVAAAKKLAFDYVSSCKRILIVPENHTRNLFYFESLAILQEIFSQAGFEVKLGTLLEEVEKPLTIHLPSGKSIVLEPIKKENNQIKCQHFVPCLILLNHDLSEGIPEILKNIQQTIAPPLQLGWWARKKSKHFQYYYEAAEEFASTFQLDPWQIRADFEVCEDIDFVKRENENHLIQKAEHLLTKIQKKYEERHITQKPFIVIKADSGTYGMGVLMISDAEQIRTLSQKERLKMSSTKGNQNIDQVILQEGIYTIDKDKSNLTAEPVIYMIETDVIGGFYRTHPQKKADENLNSPGMTFQPIDIFKCPNFNKYQIIARLALLAAARELRGAKT